MDVTLDFETRSKADIACGPNRYAQDPSTEALILCWMFDDSGRIGVWTYEEGGIPEGLRQAVLDDSCTFHAYNAQFEIAIWTHVMCVRHGWPSPPPLHRWRDTMAEVAIAGYPQSMDKASALLGASQKDATGKKLIKFFSVPDKKGEFTDPSEEFVLFLDFINYCKQDVVTERDIHKRLSWVKSESEQKVWELVVKMNQRGLPIDIDLVEVVAVQLEKNKLHLGTQVSLLTDGRVEKPTQVARILAELSRYGLDLKNLTAETLDELDTEGLPHGAKALITFRQLGGRSSTAKFNRILELICSDGTVKDNLRYYGAGPGRMSGSGFQPQNLPRYKHKDPEHVIDAFMTMDAELLRLVFNVEQAASGLIRPSILAPPSKLICAYDFSGVEAAGVCWLCDEQDLIQKILAGLDMYKVQAADMFHVNYDEVDSLQRQVGKILVLACGYAGGFVVFVNQAKIYRLDVTEDEAKKYVRMFRNSRPKLTQAWKEFENTAMLAMGHPGDIFQVGNKPVAFQYLRGFLKMTLPSGRGIYYPEPKLTSVPSRFDGQNITAITTKWTNSQTHQWGERVMSGPLFFQNAIQGICRDLLVEAQMRLESFGVQQIGSVHDEAISLLDEAGGPTLADVKAIMDIVPPWAKGFPLGGSGYAEKRYKKD